MVNSVVVSIFDGFEFFVVLYDFEFSLEKFNVHFILIKLNLYDYLSRF